MELDYKSMNLNRHKGRAVSQITLEEDLNVPDQKPDIFRMVHKQGEFHPDEIKGEAGKVKARGVFRYRILYIAEGDERRPEILEGSIPVDEMIFLNGLEEGDLLDFRWDLEDLHVSAIHSRKANIKAILSLCAEAICEQPVLLLKEPEEEIPGTYLKTCLIRLQQETIHKKDTLRVKEELTLPPGRPNIRRIIWKEFRLQGTEVRPEEGKLLVKGELVVFFLYESEEDPVRIQWVEQSVPFSSEIECAACHSDLSGKTEVTLLRGELELQADYDGEPRMVRLDAVLTLLLRYFEEQSEETVCDAYSLDCELSPGRKRCQWNYVQHVSDSRARVSGRMKLKEGEPKVLQILNSGAFLIWKGENGELSFRERWSSGLFIWRQMIRSRSPARFILFRLSIRRSFRIRKQREPYRLSSVWISSR